MSWKQQRKSENKSYFTKNIKKHNYFWFETWKPEKNHYLENLGEVHNQIWRHKNQDFDRQNKRIQ